MTEHGLEVYLSGNHIGSLRREGAGPAEFRFREKYLYRVQRPVLGQKFEDDLEKTYRAKNSGEVPPFFSNLIPEGRLRQFILEATQIPEGNEWDLLSFVGADLPGAVEVRPSEVVTPFETEAGAAEEKAADKEKLAHEEGATALRFSLAGVQLKFSMLREGEKLTLPAHGANGDWIVKFPSPTYPLLPENEFSMMEWSRVAGFDVPETHLDDASFVQGSPARWLEPETKILSVRRFDRDGARRIHQEDFAQIVGAPPSLKYANLTYEKMAVLVRGILDEAACDEFVRRLTLMIACGNNDAHLKNWSFVYPNGIEAVWSPLYDQVSTVGWSKPDRTLALNLGSVKDFGRLDRDAFGRFSARAGLRTERVLTQVEETLASLRDAWVSAGDSWPLSESHRQALVEHWQRVPLLREAGGLG